MRASKSLPLNKAAELIAATLGSADPQHDADPALLEAAWQQLIQALFDGEVKSEGVFWEPLEPYQPGVTQPDVWVELERGWWSKNSDEKFVLIQKVKRNQLSKSDEILRDKFLKYLKKAQREEAQREKAQGPDGKQLEELPQTSDESRKIIEFEKMTLYWDQDNFEVYDRDGSLWGYVDIRVNSRDLQSYFGVLLEDVKIANREAKAKKQPSPRTQEEILQHILSFPRRSRTRAEMIKDVIDKYNISRDEARRIYGQVPEEHKFQRGQKRSPFRQIGETNRRQL